MNAQPKTRSLAAPLILIALGSVFLIQNLTQINVFRILKSLWPYWPVILIVLGVSKLVEYFRSQSIR